MSKISFLIATLLFVAITARPNDSQVSSTTSTSSSSTTSSPSSSSVPVVSAGDHANKQTKPAVIAAGAVEDHQVSPQETHTAKRRDAPPEIAVSPVKPQQGQTTPSNKNNTVCPQNYEPVCGSNKEVYSNLCALGLAQKTNPSIVAVNKEECGP